MRSFRRVHSAGRMLEAAAACRIDEENRDPEWLIAAHACARLDALLLLAS
jgi:hypothetical protein